MWITGDLAYQVLLAARAWQDARLAACRNPIKEFRKNAKGENEPVYDPQVWFDLGAAETALSTAITNHRDADS